MSFALLLSWLQTTAGAITATAIIGGALFGLGRAVRSVFRKIHRVYEELIPNGGGSIKDQLNRIESVCRAALRMTDKAYWISDISGAFTEISPPLTELMGKTSEQTLGSGWMTSVHPSDAQRVREEWLTAVHEHREFYLPFRFMQPDGRIAHVVGHSQPLTIKKRKATGETEIQTIGYIGWVEEQQFTPSTIPVDTKNEKG